MGHSFDKKKARKHRKQRVYELCVTFKNTHFQLVEAMHLPLEMHIFKISEVRHLDVSAFSGRREFRKAAMHLDLRSSF